MFICQISPCTGLADFTLITPGYWNSLFHRPISPASIQRNIFAAEAIHTVPIFRATWYYYFWVDRGNGDSKLAQSFYTWPALRESNPRPLDLGSNALTIRPHTPRDNKWQLETCLFHGYALMFGLCPFNISQQLKQNVKRLIDTCCWWECIFSKWSTQSILDTMLNYLFYRRGVHTLR